MKQRGKPEHAGKAPVWLSIACCALSGYAVWARGGTLPALQPPLLLLGAWVFAALLFHLRGRTGRVLCRDPFFWFGLLFLLLLVVQTWNTGRTLYFHPFEERWIFTPPPVPYLPWSFDRSESFQMLYWFAPAWVLALALRHAPDRALLAQRVLIFFIINGTTLALFGIVQHMTGSDVVYRFSESGRGAYYASFGYRNHAVAYLLLVLAASLGHLGYHVRRRRLMAERGAPLATLGAASATLIVFVAIHPALGRAAILLAWTLVLLFLGVLLIRRDPMRRPSVRLQIGIVIILTFGMALSWIVILGGSAMFRLLEYYSKDTLLADFNNRSWMWLAAWRIWEDHPWWGVGGWGYRHLLPFYAEGAGLLEVHLPGKANTHNDALQFLAEFGAAGFALLLTATGILYGRFVQGWREAWGRPSSAIYAGAGAGLVMVGLHSLLDLPYRNPAVLLACVILLVAVPEAWSNTCFPKTTNNRE